MAHTLITNKMIMKYHRATTLFIRFIRENKISFRYKNELFGYLIASNMFDIHSCRLIEACNGCILSYINGNGLNCFTDDYDTPLYFAMTWRRTASGDGYWRDKQKVEILFFRKKWKETLKCLLDS